LCNDHPPLIRINHFFEHLLDETARDPQRKGCLLVNTLLETPAEDTEITHHAAKALHDVERTLMEVLKEANWLISWIARQPPGY
jgi:TetR/AcrR family transcriptional repressor of nem operon